MTTIPAPPDVNNSSFYFTSDNVQDFSCHNDHFAFKLIFNYTTLQQGWCNWMLPSVFRCRCYPFVRSWWSTLHMTVTDYSTFKGLCTLIFMIIFFSTFYLPISFNIS